MPTINIRINKDLKEQSKIIFDNLGLDMTTAITIYLKAVIRNNGIPFSLEIPNKETLKSFKEVEKITINKEKAKKYKSINELRKDLNV